MWNWSANLSLLFADRPLPQRLEAAARVGFGAVEMQFPYAWDARPLRAALDEQGLRMVLHNLPAGDWAAGERGIACHPDRRAEFRDGVQQALHWATTLGVRQLNCLAGLLPDGLARRDVEATLLANLRHAAHQLARHGITLLLEPINRHDMPGFLIATADEALAVLDAVGAPNARLQLDLYHAARMGADPARLLRQHAHRVGHVQVADVPGRHEPGTGRLPYRALFALLSELGYRGWVGCEYVPQRAGRGGTEAGLHWMAAHGNGLRAGASSLARPCRADGAQPVGVQRVGGAFFTIGRS